ncbi:MAG: hypothetical protein K8L99_18015 [Anaerolineae bacterium]|nr:hypothetical protein [Anaerolineae bacterium]
MTFSRIHVTRAVSLREFIDMSSTGNILLGSDVHIHNLRNMIVGKILDEHFSETEVHVRFADPKELRSGLGLLKKIAADGVPVYVWTTEQEADISEPELSTVIIKPDFPVASENFLIVATPADARSLVWWSTNGHTRAPNYNDVIGLLITKPDDTQALLLKIHSILKM